MFEGVPVGPVSWYGLAVPCCLCGVGLLSSDLGADWPLEIHKSGGGGRNES